MTNETLTKLEDLFNSVIEENGNTTPQEVLDKIKNTMLYHGQKLAQAPTVRKQLKEICSQEEGCEETELYHEWELLYLSYVVKKIQALDYFVL